MNAKRTSHRPRCRYCNRQLVKHTVPVTVGAGTEIKVGDSVAHPYDPDRVVTVLEIMRVRKGAQFAGMGPTKTYSIWYGSYGRDGLSMFCGPQCGYRFAIETIQDKDNDHESCDDD